MINVLDHGFVRLVDHMGDDARIVQAARVSYGKGTRSSLEDAALIDYLMRHAHTSPFEMVEFTFHVKAPIFVVRQWFRHRTASVNEVSGRYSVMEELFYQPEPGALRRQDRTNRQGSVGPLPPETAEEAGETIRAVQRNSYEAYQALLHHGLAREQARVVLPLSLYSEFYWKQNLHNLLHFLKLRMDAHAQREIQLYASAIAQLVREVTPVAYAAFEEHTLKAVRFSASEMEAIKTHLDKESLRQTLAEHGFKKSRIAEILDKIYKDD